MPTKAKAMARGGGIKAHSGGRADHVPLKVPKGAYVLPADIVSGLGQGNSQAGMKVLDGMFKSGPYGLPRAQMPRNNQYLMARNMQQQLRPRRFADGGDVGSDVPILASGGEYIVPPEVVSSIGDGDMSAGHSVLDEFVKKIRTSTINEMSQLPGPEK